MTILRRLLAGLGVLLLLVVGWMWWTRPVGVEMSAYVPADALVYFEANDLPAVARALASTEALRSIPPERRRGLEWAGTPWVQRLISFTGLAPHRAAVLARAQVAVAVLGFEARKDEAGGVLRFSPRLALVAETHTPEWRVRPAVEQLVGELARRSYGGARVERKEVDGVRFVAWVSPEDGGRRIVAAVSESLAVVGNDEAAVRACLEVRRGSRPSLAGDARLGQMRERVEGDGALAFGYAPQGGAARVVETLAPAFAGGVSDDPRVQSLLATLMPRLVNQIVGEVGWAARPAGGWVEESYFVSLPGGIPQRLEAPFATFGRWGEGGAALLPHDTFQFTQYNFRSPELAWRGLGATLSSQLDIRYATVLTLGLEALVKPYGVERPREFLRAVGPDIVTARLTKESRRKVLIVEAFDREALAARVRNLLGPRPRVEKVGETEILVSADPELGAAAFVTGRLLLGDAEDVRRCVEAAAAGRTLHAGGALKLLAPPLSDEHAFTRTLTDDREAAASTLALLTAPARGGDGDGARAQGPAADEAFYSLSATRLTGEGFEKKSRSAFGLFGELIARAAPKK